MTERAKENLAYWCRLHHLPPHFPSLSANDRLPGTPAPDPFLRDDGAELRQVIDQVLGSFRSMIVVAPGQGASTLLAEMSRKLKTNDIRSFDLLIRVDVAGLADSDDLTALLEEVVRRDIFRQLAMQRWIGTLQGPRRQMLLMLFDTANDRRVYDLEYGLWHGDPNAEGELNAIADRHEGELARLVKTLHGYLGLSVTLAFDFPYQADEDLVLELFREIKWFDETEKGDGFPQAALRETYFLTRKQANLARSVWTVNFHEVELRPFSKGEFSQLLNYHFRPKAAGQIHPLVNVLSSGFVDRVWAESKPFVEMSRELEAEILASLDCDPSAVPYALVPVDQNSARF